MALYEYFCEPCQASFEQLNFSDEDPEMGQCPRCRGKKTRKLISKFAVGGRGDLRESTMHGCHDCNVSLPGEQGAHSESTSDSASGHDHPGHHDHHGSGHDHE